MIERVSFRAFVAATEDEGRVREALGTFVPLDRISGTSVQGHYGNEIKILEARLMRKECQVFFRILRERLPKKDLSRLRQEMSARLEGDSHFHLRLDKQAAYDGIACLTESKDAIDVCAIITTYPARRANALRIISELL